MGDLGKASHGLRRHLIRHEADKYLLLCELIICLRDEVRVHGRGETYVSIFDVLPCFPACDLRGAKSGYATVMILKAYDVILAEIRARLNLYELKWNFSRVL